MIITFCLACKDTKNFLKMMRLYTNSQKYFEAVDLEDAADAGLAYLVRVEQFELLGALVEVVTQGDAVAPALDLPALGPELQVNRVAGLQHTAQCADVNTLCHCLIGMRGQTVR